MKKSCCRVFITGQCTLHWGRMEFGNMGNYYIADALLKELRRVFPESELATTMQFSDEFCQRYNIEIVPMSAYYDFNRKDNLKIAQEELDAVVNGKNIESRFIDEVKKASFVIDFSGDLWGENACLLGENRFEVGCYKDIVAQKIKPTVMIAGSPGPFDKEKIELAKKAYEGFAYVTNREPESTKALERQGFNLDHTDTYPCPSFLFEGILEKEIYKKEEIFSTNKKDINVGFIMCGWNFARGTFDRWPRNNEEYESFKQLIEYIIKKYDAGIFLLSHANGFTRKGDTFNLIQGRDFPILKQLYELLTEEGFGKNVTLIEGVYSPEATRKIISGLDMLISGRMHGAIAGVSQCIPTIFIDYGHEPKAHKLKGITELLGMEECLVNPTDLKQMEETFDLYMGKRREIKEYLCQKNIEIKSNARKQFDILGTLFNV